MDTMTLNKEDGTIEEIEIVITFKLENFNNDDYVIYKTNNEFFGAKYIEKSGNTELITDLSDEEKKSLSEIFEKLRKEGIIQC